MRCRREKSGDGVTVNLGDSAATNYRRSCGMVQSFRLTLRNYGRRHHTLNIICNLAPPPLCIYGESSSWTSDFRRWWKNLNKTKRDNSELFFYTHYNTEKHRNDIEIDFLISNMSKTKFKLYPIEVKSSAKYKTRSLDTFVEKYHERIDRAYVIHPKNLSVNENRICIPPYITICL